MNVLHVEVYEREPIARIFTILVSFYMIAQRGWLSEKKCQGACIYRVSDKFCKRRLY
jgi:hypothetical protein